jgi:hypothetical protein
MAGIKQLSEVYKKQGSEFIDNLFADEVTVSEKLNGMSFSFEKSIGEGTLFFYKRDQVNPISKIDRVLMNYYDEPISYIQGLPELTKNEIPPGWRFGTEFFINEGPVLLSYNNVPKNGLVLTHIIVKNQFGDVERTIVEKEELDYWADLIGIERAPIIFQGKLSDLQKSAINDFVNSPFDTLKSTYGTQSFAKYLVKTLNPDLNKTLLNNDLDQPIEGVVFRFGPINGTGDSFSAKIIDPVFEDITRQNNSKKASYFPSDIYGITLIEVMNFILDKGIESFEFSGEDPQDKYISFICSVFNSFVEENGEKYLGLDFQEPEFLKHGGSESNLDLINNEETRGLVSQDESYESLFKLILSAFRKIKKKAGGFFTPGVIDQFNLLVREISDHLNRKSAIVESLIPTFDEFRKVKKSFVPDEESDEEQEDEEQEDEEGSEPEMISDPSEHPLEEPEIEEEPEEDSEEESEVDIEDEKEGEKTDVDPEIAFKMQAALGQTDPISDPAIDPDAKDVNIIIGKFQPFNNGHLKMIKKANQTNGNPVALMVVNSSKGFINKEVMDKMMKIISNDLSDLVHSVNYVPDDLLSTSIEKIKDKCNPKSLTVGTKKLDNYLVQSRTLKKRKKIPQDFQIQTSPEWVISREVMKTLEDKDYMQFKKHVPKALSSLWEELHRCYESSK